MKPCGNATGKEETRHGRTSVLLPDRTRHRRSSLFFSCESETLFKEGLRRCSTPPLWGTGFKRGMLGRDKIACILVTGISASHWHPAKIAPNVDPPHQTAFASYTARQRSCDMTGED